MDTIRKVVTFETLDASESIEILNPSEPYTVTTYVQGKSIVTPTGNKITQVLYDGFKISLTWPGLSVDEYEALSLFMKDNAYKGFTFISPDEVTYKCVVDGLTSLTSSLKYVREVGKIKQSVTLKLITIP